MAFAFFEKLLSSFSRAQPQEKKQVPATALTELLVVCSEADSAMQETQAQPCETAEDPEKDHPNRKSYSAGRKQKKGRQIRVQLLDEEELATAGFEPMGTNVDHRRHHLRRAARKERDLIIRAARRAKDESRMYG